MALTLAKKSQIILDHARERTPFQVRVSSCWYLQGSKLPVPFFWQLCIGFPAMILESQPKYPACHPPFWRQYIKQWPDYPRRTFLRGPETRRVSNRDEERKHVQHPVKWHAHLMNFTSPWGAFPRHGHHQVLFWASVCVCVCQVFKHSASNAMTLLHGHASWCHVSTLCSLMMLSSSEREFASRILWQSGNMESTSISLCVVYDGICRMNQVYEASNFRTQ